MISTATRVTNPLQQFQAELLEDSALQERFKAATDTENMCSLVLELGKEKGYSFTREEILAVMAIESVDLGEILESDHTVIARGGNIEGWW